MFLAFKKYTYQLRMQIKIMHQLSDLFLEMMKWEKLHLKNFKFKYLIHLEEKFKKIFRIANPCWLWESYTNFGEKNCICKS